MKARFGSQSEGNGRVMLIDTATLHLLTGVLCLGLAAAPIHMTAANAPGGPGNPSVCATAVKDFLGTSATGDSKVYFTGADGNITEVFYPSPDQVQNIDLRFIVTSARQKLPANIAVRTLPLHHSTSLVNKRAMVWSVTTTPFIERGTWKITKKIFTDPDRQSLVQRVTFETHEPGKTVRDYNVYVYSNPSIDNGGNTNNSRTLKYGSRVMLVASMPNSTSSALAASLPWRSTRFFLHPWVSSGYVGQSDGLTDLHDGKMGWHYEGAYDGNVAQLGWLDWGKNKGTSASFDVVLGFGHNEKTAMAAANDTLRSDLELVENKYTQQWETYCQGLDSQNGLADDQYYLASMTLKSVQDKVNGGMVAGLGTPWGDKRGDTNLIYHLVWSRDLFKFASALIAAGDTESANKAVSYLFNVQMQPDGRFPQNTRIDGTPYWNGTQMDETAMPIILAWKLNRFDLWTKVKMAAEYLAHNGPRTDQDRWEEMAGYSPSTIAAEIAGLVCAASMADATNDINAAKYYREKADYWRNNVANWTFTTSGFHGNSKYYLRITDNQDPNDDVMLDFKNGSGYHGERYIIDGGFLELSRLGVMSPSNWTLLETLPEYDAILKQTIPGKGDAWFRYNYDGYGEHNDGAPYEDNVPGGRGRLWPIFTAERGIYEIAKSGNGAAGQPYLAALKAFSSPSGFIPEQVWNVSANITGWQTDLPAGCVAGTPTGSMCPLNWAMGEYINLVAAMNHGHGDAPAVVVQRYVSDQPQTTITFKVNNATTNPGQNIYLVGNHPLLGEWSPLSGVKMSPTNYPTWSVTLSLPASTSFEYKYLKYDGTITNWEDGDNRPLLTPSSGETVQEDTFR